MVPESVNVLIYMETPEADSYWKWNNISLSICPDAKNVVCGWYMMKNCI